MQCSSHGEICKVYEFSKCCSDCNPTVCNDCIRKFTEALLEDNATKIPCPSCPNKYFDDISLNIILGETCKHLMDRLHENLSEQYFLENLTHCPYPDCSGRFIVEDGDKYNRITCQESFFGVIVPATTRAKFHGHNKKGNPLILLKRLVGLVPNVILELRKMEDVTVSLVHVPPLLTMQVQHGIKQFK